jgi:hypothetical protein
MLPSPNLKMENAVLPPPLFNFPGHYKVPITISSSSYKVML